MHRTKILFFSAVALLVFFLWMSSGLFEMFSQTLEFSKESIELYPITSIFIFLVLAALSAMSIFFSSIVIVPLAVFAWGNIITFVLLLSGWFVGAIIIYLLGKSFGRTVIEYVVPAKKIAVYEHLISRETEILDVILFKFVLPSEIPSFFLGLVHYPFKKYILVIFISELPFAIWAVYLSGTFLENNRLLFVATLAMGIAVMTLAVRRYRKRHT